MDTTPAENTAALPPAPPAPCLSDPERWVEQHGDYLFKFALVRLRDATKAEDMVQETFLAALKGGDKFAGRSAEKSWLAGILKHKILDHYRKASRETAFTDLTMREVDGVESKEICKLLNISENNLWVMLHRARMALRHCLETNWFGK